MSAANKPHRLSLRPTLLGVKAIAFWALIAVAWFATPYSNLFFLLLCLLTVLAPLALLWSLDNLRGLDARIDQLPAVAAGSQGAVQVRLTGTRRRPAWALEVELRVEGSRRRLRSGFEASALPGQTLSARSPRRQRGLWEVRAAWISSIAPLGLLRTRRRIPCPQILAVHPVPAELPALRDRNALMAALRGDMQIAGSKQGPSGLHEYRDGDDPRHVDWKASARRAGLIVREYEDDAIQGIEVCLDRRCSNEVLEEALEIATALLLLARDDKEIFALHSQEHSARYGQGKRPYDEALVWLAGCTALESSAAAPAAVAREVLRLPLDSSAAINAATQQAVAR